MNTAAQTAKHFREIHFGGNWTCSNIKDNLTDITWQQATTQVQSFNTIATLTYHMSYYVSAVLKLLQGGPLDASDKLSFEHPPIHSQEDWESLLNSYWKDAEDLAVLIEQLPDSKLWENLPNEKHGNYFRNIHGIVEHSHYHLGQIVILKKFILQSLSN